MRFGRLRLALKSDGTVVGWGDNSYGQLNVPAGLSGVTAIAAGDNHSLALKSDGTVVAWGSNSVGQRNVPAGLSGVIAIAAGDEHSLVLKSDGTVLAWGAIFDPINIPTWLSGVTAIAANGLYNMAIVADRTAPNANPSLSPAANAAGWNNGDVSVAWNWTDSGVGIDPANCTMSSASSGEGDFPLNATCYDLAGNEGNANRACCTSSTSL